MDTCSVCGTRYDRSQQPIYCLYCGWPLARLKASVSPEPLILERNATGEVVVTLSNQGAGILQCRVDIPNELTKSPEQETQFDSISKAPERLRLTFDSRKLTTAVGAGSLTLSVTAFDAHPAEFRDPHTGINKFRPASREEAVLGRTVAVPVPFVFREPGLVTILTPNLLFRKSNTPQTLTLLNGGGIDTAVTLTCNNGFLLKTVGDQPGATSVRLNLSPNVPRSVQVQSPLQAAAGRAGEITLQGSGLVDAMGEPTETQAIGLYWLKPKASAKPTQRYMIGIDFGTAKSAVFVLDRMQYASNQSAMQMRPINIPFPNKGIDSPTVPSEVMFPGTGGAPRFGFEAYTENPDNLRVRSIKTLLNSDTVQKHPITGREYTPLEIVTEFLKGLISQIRLSKAIPRDDPHADIFKEALVVMTLPVLDDETQFEKQKSLTVQAARAAGLPEDVVIVCEKEPECAIVDILRRKAEYGLDIKHDQVGIIVDAGAGTLDISVLQVVIENTQPTFSRLVLAGYPLGGDLIDSLIYTDYQNSIGLPADVTERKLLSQALRTLKHELPLIPDSKILNIETHVISKKLSVTSKEYQLSWQKIHSLFKDYLEQALTSETGLKESEVAKAMGYQPIDHDKVYPSLLTQMKGTTHPYQVAWVCLTGGTSIVPLLRRELKKIFSNAQIIPEEAQFQKLYDASRIFFTLNVAQGAAIRPLFTFEGLLSLSIQVKCYSALSGQVYPQYGNSDVVLEQPGDRGRSSRYSIEPTDTLEFQIFSTLNGTEVEWGRYRLHNPDTDNPVDVSIRLHYENNQHIVLEVDSPLLASSDAQSQPSAPHKITLIS